MAKQKIVSILIILMVLAFVVPQITLAAWWNPFSWGVWNNVFHFQQTAQKLEKQINKNSLNSIQLSAANPTDATKTDTFNFSNDKVLLNQGTANVVNYTLAKTAIGDLNGDGSQDGVLAAYQGYGANIIKVILFAVVNNNGKLAEADYVLPMAGQTMDAEIKSLSISSGVLTLNLVLVSTQDQQNLPHYQWKPTIEKTIQYKLVNGKLVEQQADQTADTLILSGTINNEVITTNPSSHCGPCFTSDDGKYNCVLMTSKVLPIYSDSNLVVKDLDSYVGKEATLYASEYTGASTLMCPITLSVDKIVVK